MGRAFAEKILARNSGLADVRAGQVIDAYPDLVLSHDNTAAIIDIWRRLGQAKIPAPEKLVFVLDHAVPAPTTTHAENHARIRAFVSQQGIENFFDAGRGICHQVLAEECLARPGMVILGADSHTTHYGALGAFSAGIGRSEAAAIWATGSLWLRVPESIKITVNGNLSAWVTSKDLALHIIGTLGADAGNYASVELHGSAIQALSMESRFVLPNLMAEMGVKNAWIAPDDTTLQWLRRQATRAGKGSQMPDGWLTPEDWWFPDADAAYAREVTFDASQIEPQVARPHTVDNVVPLSQVAGTAVQQAFLGTCTNGRLEDLAVAARVVAGRRVHPGTRLLVIPAWAQVLEDALHLGYVETLLLAGAMLGVPGCGPCMGNHMGVPAPGEVTISTANRNFRGRMGTRDSEVYLASPAVVAASAIAGVIIHPDNL